MDESTTRQLSDILSRIDSTRGMDQYMEIPKVAESCQSFRQYFHSLPAVQNMDSGDLIQKSGLERSYCPGRDKVLRLCLGAGLTLRQTTRALELSGNAVLYPRNRRDIILTVAINQKAGVDDANILLFNYGEDPLS